MADPGLRGRIVLSEAATRWRLENARRFEHLNGACFVFGPDEQSGRSRQAEAEVGATGVIGGNHGFDAGIVEIALRHFRFVSPIESGDFSGIVLILHCSLPVVDTCN